MLRMSVVDHCPYIDDDGELHESGKKERMKTRTRSIRNDVLYGAILSFIYIYILLIFSNVGQCFDLGIKRESVCYQSTFKHKFCAVVPQLINEIFHLFTL